MQGAGEKVTLGQGRGSLSLRKQEGPRLGWGEVGISASLPAGLSPHGIPACYLDPLSHL